MDANGNKVNDLFFPMSLRVKDSSVEKSNSREVVDFIFAKDASVGQYGDLLVADEGKLLPETIRHKIDIKFYD